MSRRPGIYSGEDVYIGNVLLNTIDSDNVAWLVTDIEGWWGLPDVEVPDDPRPFAQDGSYYTTGRYNPRIINLRGIILPLDGKSNKAVTARNAFNRALNLVRRRVELKVREEGAFKTALVQLSSKPLVEISATTGYLQFDIALKATDPLKYADSNKYFSVGLEVSTPGRTYDRIFDFSYGGAATSNTVVVENDGSYESFPEFTVTGPVLNPKIEHINSGQSLEFNTEITIGNPMIIRPLTKQVLVQGQNKRNTLSPKSKWFPIYPGTNIIRFTGTQTIPPQQPMNPQRNLAPNPIPADAGAAGTFGAELRRNRAIIPKPTAYTNFTAGTGTSNTVESNGGMNQNASWLARTLTAAGTAGAFLSIIGDNAASRIPVTAGTAYTFGASLLYSSPATRATVYVTWRDSGGAQLSQTIFPNTPGPNNQWHRVYGTATAPAGATTAALGVSVGPIDSWIIGERIGVTEFSAEIATTVASVTNPVFNSTPTDATQWNPGSSVSRAVVTDGGSPAMEVTVTTANTPGSTYTYAGQQSMSSVPGIGNWAAVSLDVKPLNTETANSLRTLLRLQNGSTTTEQFYTPTGGLTVGQWTRITASVQQLTASDNLDVLVWPTGNLPLGAAWRARRVIVGFGGSQAEAEQAVATYWDGDTANEPGIMYAWANAANNSASLKISNPNYFDGATTLSDRNKRTRWVGTANASASTISYYARGWDAPEYSLFRSENSTSLVRRAGSTSVKYTRLNVNQADRRLVTIDNLGQYASGWSTAPMIYSDFQNSVSVYVNPSIEGSEAVFTLKHYSIGGALLSTTVSEPIALSATNWQRILFTDTTTTPINSNRMTISLEIRYTGTDNAHIGATVGVQDAKVSVWTVADEPYFDGSYPFARWESTANRSDSVIDEYVPEVPNAMLYVTSRDAWIE